MTQTVSLSTWLLIPTIAALIGWFTNWVAVKMLFRPRKPINVIGLKIWGLVPKRQKDLAMSIGETVEKDLVKHEDIAAILRSDAVHTEIRKEIEAQIDIFLGSVAGTNPMIGMFLQGELAAQIKKMLVEQLEKTTPDMLEKVVTNIEANLDFKDIVRQRIESFDLSSLEALIYRISSNELKTIEILGGVLGFFVGVVQVLLMYIL
jgi:uncharacterized membrane protein YheB (UPF0754 family)